MFLALFLCWNFINSLTFLALQLRYNFRVVESKRIGWNGIATDDETKSWAKNKKMTRNENKSNVLGRVEIAFAIRSMSAQFRSSKYEVRRKQISSHYIEMDWLFIGTMLCCDSTKRDFRSTAMNSEKKSFRFSPPFKRKSFLLVALPFFSISQPIFGDWEWEREETTTGRTLFTSANIN